MCAVYVGSTFIQEALRKARELTDAAYARTNERSVTMTSFDFILYEVTYDMNRL